MSYFKAIDRHWELKARHEYESLGPSNTDPFCATFVNYGVHPKKMSLGGCNSNEISSSLVTTVPHLRVKSIGI
jgi:hypothetical protein